MSMLQPVDLAALALDCLRLLQPAALARGVSVVLQFEPPDARPESRVMPSRPLSLEECARTEMKKPGRPQLLIHAERILAIQLFLRRPTRPRPSIPAPTSSRLVGSGTTANFTNESVNSTESRRSAGPHTQVREDLLAAPPRGYGIQTPFFSLLTPSATTLGKLDATLGVGGSRR